MSDTLSITGRVTHVLDMEQGTSARGEWRKQSFVVETQGKYPDPVHFVVWNDKIEEVVPEAGQMVTVAFNVKSREYNDRWYTDLTAWRVDVEQGQELPAPEASEWDDTDGSLPF